MIKIYKIFKKFFIISIFVFSTNILNAKIIFDKSDIIITEIELKEYIKIHRKYTDENLGEEIAIKNIYLMKKTLNKLINKSPDYINNLDNIISREFGTKILNNNIHKDYLRLFKFRNEFIINYFNKNLDENDIHTIFKNINTLPLPLSSNQCLTVDFVLDLSDNENFAKVFYENLKLNSKEFNLVIDNNEYNICIDEKKFKYLENLIIDFIELKTEKNFNEFIYNE